MSNSPAPTDPIAREEWLEEGLSAGEAAEFLPSTAEWLDRARATPGLGPDFYRVGRRVYYTRRALIEHRERTRNQRQGKPQSEAPSDGAGGVDEGEA